MVKQEMEKYLNTLIRKAMDELGKTGSTASYINPLARSSYVHIETLNDFASIPDIVLRSKCQGIGPVGYAVLTKAKSYVMDLEKDESKKVSKAVFERKSFSSDTDWDYVCNALGVSKFSDIINWTGDGWEATAELLPCPFCGGYASLSKNPGTDKGRMTYSRNPVFERYASCWAHCGGCNAQIHRGADTYEEARKLAKHDWNQRVQDTADNK